MSITFSSPASRVSYITQPCDFPGCCEENPCGYCDGGIEQIRVTEAPELNFNNGNARIIIAVLGLPQDAPMDMWGKVAPELLPTIRQRIMYLRNRPLALAPHTRETSDTQLPGQCRVIHGGIDTQAILSRLERLDALFAWAQEHNTEVCWG
jgi:hypothetical protein